ncbi:regulator of G-protein signaling 7-binding protein A [Trichonephila clavipes]|nr:regulator of G-protein signaling 7-binding protein A [Trichonephila clavipes]
MEMLHKKRSGIPYHPRRQFLDLPEIIGNCLSKWCCKLIIEELNSLVASFRDLLIHIGKGHDNPEIRDKMRVIRKKCVERCTAANRVLMPQIRK